MSDPNTRQPTHVRLDLYIRKRYGSTDFTPSTFLDPLPDLRFNDGDVIVKLRESPDSWLLLHKKTIQATMPVLGQALTEDWERHELVKDLKSNTKKNV